MGLYQQEYRRKLITPSKAAELIQDNVALVHELAMAGPPELLAAIAAHLHAGDLKKFKTLL